MKWYYFLQKSFCALIRRFFGKSWKIFNVGKNMMKSFLPRRKRFPLFTSFLNKHAQERIMPVVADRLFLVAINSFWGLPCSCEVSMSLYIEICFAAELFAGKSFGLHYMHYKFWTAFFVYRSIWCDYCPRHVH